MRSTARSAVVAKLLLVMILAWPLVALAAIAYIPSTGGGVRYHSPEEACSLGVMGAYIEGNRPSQPANAQYRILSSAVSGDTGEGDHTCQGDVYVGVGNSPTSWTLVVFAGEALIVGSAESCNIPGYVDPVTGQCGSPKCTDECCGSCPNGSNPIHTASGNKHQVERDFIGMGAFPLRFERTYNSNRATENAITPLGAGWTHTYGAMVVGIGNGPFTKAVAYRPDGRMLALTDGETMKVALAGTYNQTPSG